MESSDFIENPMDQLISDPFGSQWNHLISFRGSSLLLKLNAANPKKQNKTKNFYYPN
jgi:hypothetical protein